MTAGSINQMYAVAGRACDRFIRAAVAGRWRVDEALYSVPSDWAPIQKNKS